MEKRLVLFFCISIVIWVGSIMIMGPPGGAPKDGDNTEAVADGDQDNTGDSDAANSDSDTDADSGDNSDSSTDSDTDNGNTNPELSATTGDGSDSSANETDAGDVPETRKEVPNQRFVLGTAAPDAKHKLLAFFTNQGAALDRVEIVQRDAKGRFAYRDLDMRGGYLGYLALSNEAGGGCKVNVIAPGTPAATATTSDGQTGLQVGDVIMSVAGVDVNSATTFDATVGKNKPKTEVEVQVKRADASLTFTAKLEDKPFAVIQREWNTKAGDWAPLSLRMTLNQLGGAEAEKDKSEIAKLPSLLNGNWTATNVTEDAISFEFDLLNADLEAAGESGSLKIVKRFRLPPASEDGLTDYHLPVDIEIQNTGSADQKVAYQLDGPTGLPLEGWWYSTKIHQEWSAAGARDVVWRPMTRSREMRSASEIYHKSQDEDDPAPYSLVGDAGQESYRYLAVDTQFFASALMLADPESENGIEAQKAYAIAAGPIPDFENKGYAKTLNTTFRIISPQQTIAAGQSFKQQMSLFAGPKSNEIIEAYNIEDVTYYGWPVFKLFARPLGAILHVFYGIVKNYGLAIIMLTVLVRGCMFPLSRKAAKNTQKMQELAPEIKKISDKYKNDMEKRMAAQRELYAKHNFNPMGGCLLMFVQLPIFIGLYRCLSVDVELRQAALIPGIQWCSNLAGPDMLLNWSSWMPAFFTGEIGWFKLGPFLNVLPLVTVALFLIQQKMFMPPPTDEQQEMQQKIMKYMMIFFAFMFFKVPSGLCIYFIASSIWGIAERKLLPKSTPPGETTEAPKPSLAAKLTGTAETESAADKKQEQRKQRKKNRKK